MKRVDDQEQSVAFLALKVFFQLVDDGAFRIGVEAERADIEIVVVVEKPDLRSFRARRSGIRLPLEKTGGRSGKFPHHLIQLPVQGDRSFDRYRLHDPLGANPLVIDVPCAVGA